MRNQPEDLKISDNYPEYDISTYGYLWQFTDQYDQVASNTLQDIGSGIACMILISLLLIPSLTCAVWITLAIVSIDVGIIGYMTWWGVNLDPISMITICMAIGFSVDYTAHIIYGYVANNEGTPNERTIVAMEKLGWPVFQGAFSTILGVLVLAFVDSYLINVFFKMVFLSIFIGMIHALIFLPVFLSIVMPLVEKANQNFVIPIVNRIRLSVVSLWKRLFSSKNQKDARI